LPWDANELQMQHFANDGDKFSSVDARSRGAVRTHVVPEMNLAT